MRSKISEIQADRKNIFRKVGETLCHIWRETEENTLWKSRRALFGEDFRDMYELLQNRFLFVEGGNDEYLFLEHYVLLGNFMNDPDRFGVFDALLLDFVREIVLDDDNAEELSKARKTYERLLEQARLLRSEIMRVEQEQDELAQSNTAKVQTNSRSSSASKTGPLRGSDPARVEDLRRKAESLERNLAELGPQIDAAKQRLEFLTEEYKSRLGDYLNQPANARRLFDALGCLRRRRSQRRNARRGCWKNGCTGSRSAICCFTCSPATKFAGSTANIARRSTCSSSRRRWSIARRPSASSRFWSSSRRGRFR